jgi:hypothetical protein
VGESARLGVLACGTVRESDETALGAVCDGVSCRSSPSSSAAWSVVSISSALATQINLSGKLGRNRKVVINMMIDEHSLE